MPGMILQWNVLGYRTRYPTIQTILSEHLIDVMCFQETRMGESTLRPPKGFTPYLSTHPRGPATVGGAVVLVRNYPVGGDPTADPLAGGSC